MRFAAVLFAFLTLSASADFYIGDPAFGPDVPRALPGRVLVASDGEMFYVFARYGMNRVRSDGTIVDLEPFYVPEMINPVSVAYGDGLLVVLHQQVNSLNANANWATAMTTDGQIAWSGAFVSNSSASIAYDGREFVVVARDENLIRAHFLDRAGFIVRSMIIAASSQSVRPSSPRVVRTDAGLIAVWRETGDLRAVSFDASGPRSEAMTIGTGTMSGAFGTEFDGSYAVESAGAHAVVLWVNEDASRYWVSGRALDASGLPAGSQFERDLTRQAFTPDLVWNGINYQAAWVALSADFQQAPLELAQVNLQGQLSTVSEIAPTKAVLSPALAVAGDRMVLAWIDYTRGGVRGTVSQPGGPLEPLAEQVLRTVPHDAYAPAAVWSGSHYVSAWLGRTSVVFRRFDRNGVALDGEARPVAARYDAGVVRIASNGSETAFVWTDRGTVLLARIAADGTLLDPEPLVVGTGAEADTADVAASGQRFLIVWVGEGVKARRISARGGFVDPGPIAVADGDVSTTRVVFDGAKFIVALVTGRRLQAATVSIAGVAGDLVVLSEDATREHLALASNGSTHLFVSGPVYALADRDLRDVSVKEGPSIERPNLVWTGSRFVAAGGRTIVWITPGGTIAPSSLPSFLYDRPENAVASAGDGTALLVYSAPTRTIRVALYGRFIAPRRRATAHPE